MKRPWNWVRRNVDPIAIDFGTRHIRMLQLARHRGQITIIARAQREVPKAASELQAASFRSAAVKEMLAEGGFVGRDVITCLGWDELQVRNLRVPMMPPEEVGEAVRFEAAERFGLAPEEAQVRFLVAGDVRQGNDIRQEVIVLVAHRSKIEAHIQMLSDMGLRPVAIDAGPCAIFRGFERFLRREEDRGKVNSFVDLGYGGTRVVIARGPELIFFKAIPVGGARFDELVSAQLGLSPEEASQIRVRLHRQHLAAMTGQTSSLGPDQVVAENVRRAVIDTLRPALEHLSKEIGLCLRYCSVTFRGLRSDTVTVVGGEAYDQDLLRLLSEQVNMPFRVGRPMENIGSDVVFDGADRRSGQPEWATVLGLALKPVTAAVEALV